MGSDPVMQVSGLALVLAVAVGSFVSFGPQDPGRPPKIDVPATTPLRDLLPGKQKPAMEARPIAPPPADQQGAEAKVGPEPAATTTETLPGQDTLRRPTPPADLAQRRPLPPVEEPYRTQVERTDLIQEFSEPSPLEGIYHLRSIQRPGVVYTPEARGYIAIGRRTLLLHVQASPTIPTRPHLQAGVRSYRAIGDTLQMTTLVGHRNDNDGHIHVERPGILEVRRFSLVGPILRIYQSPNSFYEFERIE